MTTNILFVLQTFGTGGSERVVLDLCRRLDPGRFRCSVAAFVDGPVREMLEDGGFKNILLPMRSARQDGLRIMRDIAGFIAENKIAIVNTHHFTPFLYSFYGAKINQCKIYCTTHSRYEIDIVRRNWTLLFSGLLRASSGAIGISPEISHALSVKFKIPAVSVITITNAVDHDRFAIRIDKAAKRKELGLEESDRVIGCIGNLRKDKNYPNMIEAFKRADDVLGNLRLVIAGEGQRRKELEELIDDRQLRGKVLLLGARSDVPEILKIMDVYCLSSLREGMPLSLLEAMSAGLPCVGTDVRGIRDVVTDGDNGILVPSNEPDKLAQAFIDILSNAGMAQKLAARGREYVIREHGLNKWLKNYEELFSANGVRAS